MKKRFIGFLMLLASVLTLTHNLVAHCHEHTPISGSVLHTQHTENLPFLIQLFERTGQAEGHLEEIVFGSGIQVPKSPVLQNISSGNLSEITIVQKGLYRISLTRFYVWDLSPLHPQFPIHLGVRPPPVC